MSDNKKENLDISKDTIKPSKSTKTEVKKNGLTDDERKNFVKRKLNILGAKDGARYANLATKVVQNSKKGGK